MEKILSASPITLAMIAAVAIVAIVIGYKFLSEVLLVRTRLTREEREREDAAAKAKAGDPGWNLVGHILSFGLA